MPSGTVVQRPMQMGRIAFLLLIGYLFFLLVFQSLNQAFIWVDSMLFGEEVWHHEPYFFLYLLSKYALILGTAILIIRVCKDSRIEWDDLGLTPVGLVGSVGLGIQVFGVFPGILVFIHLFSDLFPEILQTDIFPMTKAPGISENPYWFMPEVLSGAVFMPILEEVMFRGFLFNALRKRMAGWATILCTASIFALYHTNLFALDQMVLIGMLMIVVVGIITGILREITKSLWAPLIYHILWNAGYYGLYYWRWS